MINRQNYEEFFLLYVDKELDANGKSAVEKFVNQNPDLARELELLMQATLIDYNFQFKEKQILYKKESSISLSNYEEYFLLFTDNELNEQQVEEVGSFVLKHPQLQNEFTILQKTRLKPELIVLPGKGKLYRREEKKIRRIIPLNLVRMGTAAAVAGAIYLSFAVFHNNRSNGSIIVTTAEKPAKKVEKSNNTVMQNSATEKAIALLNNKKESKKPGKRLEINGRKQVKSIIAKPEEAQSDKEVVAVKKTENTIQSPIAEQSIDIEQREAQKNEIAENSEKKINISGDNENPVSTGNDEKKNANISVAAAKEEKPVFAHAVYLETENVEQEKSTYIGSAEINKTKLKGFFKKAAAFLDKRIRRNENDN